MESEIQWSRSWLFAAYRHLRRRRHDRVLSPFSKGRTAFFGSGDFSRRRGDHGYRRYLFFREPLSWQRIAGVAFAIVGLFLLRK